MTGRLFLLWLRAGALTMTVASGTLFAVMAIISALVIAFPVKPDLLQFLRAVTVLTVTRDCAGAFLLALGAFTIATAACSAFGAESKR